MANNVKNAIDQLAEFLKSNEEKVVLIKGTHQRKKHKLVFSLMQRAEGFKKGLFRVNGLNNTADFLKQAGYDIPYNKGFKSGNAYAFRGFNLYIDSLFTQSTWRNTPSQLDFAIVYPIDSFCDEKADKKQALINDVLQRKDINKIFIITFTDVRYDYAWLEDTVDRVIVYDAKDEDPEYHNRVLAGPK
ncbi:hypothetical protein V7113_29020 [Priestia megaterium]|uniref:hypothetical protein n=1 Tax=Priestia megaterium TaxID=1404 RepID=UPI002FFE634C